MSSQENLSTDPLLNFSKFYEIGISANANRVNTNQTLFSNSKTLYQFKKNNYLPAIDASFNFGWLIKDKEAGIFIVKTGVNLVSRNTDLYDSIETKLRLSREYLQIPILFGFRSPVKYNTVKNNLYRAFELYAGFYSSTPIRQKLDSPDNIDAGSDLVPQNYLKFGIIGEMIFTAFDSKGHGHKFGLRASKDFSTIVKIKENLNELYPSYYTIAVFYNLRNKYK